MSWILKPVTILVVCGFAVHTATLCAVHRYVGAVDVFAFQSRDGAEYFQIAENLVGHGAFSQSAGAPFEPDTWRTPGYPVFLAVMMKIAGTSPVALVLIQQALAIINVVLIYGVARLRMPSRRAVVVALIVLIEPFHLYYSLWLLAATLFVTVLLLTWYTFERAWNARGLSRLAALGVLCGVLVLVRPVAIFVPLAVFAGLFVSRLSAGGRPGAVRSPWLRAGAFTLAFAIIVGAWMMRNLAVAGHFAVSHQRGIVLAYFKAAEAELWRQGRAVDRYLETSLSTAHEHDPHEVWDEIDGQLQKAFVHLPDDQRHELSWRHLAQGNETTVDAFEISKALSRVGLKMLARDPLSTCLCFTTRMGSLLMFPLNQAICPPRGVPPRRLKWTLMAGPYVVLIFAAMAGVFRKWRAAKRTAPRDGAGHGTRPGNAVVTALAPVYFPLAVTMALLVATTPQIDPRFRVPLIPMLAFMAMLPSRVGNNKNPNAAKESEKR